MLNETLLRSDSLESEWSHVDDEKADLLIERLADVRRPREGCRQTLRLILIVGVLFLPLTAVCSYYTGVHFSKSVRPRLTSECRRPVARYEWRSLGAEEQRKYLDAVVCLTTKPSRLGRNQTLYDDFPYVHFMVGAYSHKSAPFLAWHRWFIQIYEQTLRDDCGYDGHLAYWDWTLDWQDVIKAPVWSDQTFGTDGNSNIGEELLGGHCVVDGRLANYSIPFFREADLPHCLSRGFPNDTVIAENGSRCRPAEIENILSQDGFQDFFLALERGPHDAIPHIIRGDFSVFTAPADPLFFLHHAQLDRLWSIWQERDPKRRLQYEGPASSQTDRPASLDDTLPFGGFAKDVRVRDIIDTRAGELCYRYSAL